MSRQIRFAVVVLLAVASLTLPAAGDVTLQLDATVETVDNGEATVAITLTNEGDETSVAPVVSLDTAVANQTSENATYRDSTGEWLWLTVEPEETVRATATVPVQDDSVEIAVADADGNVASTTVTPNGGVSLLVVAAVVGTLLVVAGGGVVWYRRR